MRRDTPLRGERHPMVRHPDSVVREARRLHAMGYGYRRIGAALGVRRLTVMQWITGRTRAEA